MGRYGPKTIGVVGRLRRRRGIVEIVKRTRWWHVSWPREKAWTSMRRRCPWRKPVVFMRRSAWIEEELLVYFTCTHTYTYIYIFPRRSQRRREAARGEGFDRATAETDTKTDEAFWSKKKKKNSSQGQNPTHVSLRLHDNVSRDEFGRYNYVCSYARVPGYPFRFFPTRPFFIVPPSPLEEGGPFEFSLKKSQHPFTKGQGFQSSFFTTTEK